MAEKVMGSGYEWEIVRDDDDLDAIEFGSSVLDSVAQEAALRTELQILLDGARARIRTLGGRLAAWQKLAEEYNWTCPNCWKPWDNDHLSDCPEKPDGGAE